MVSRILAVYGILHHVAKGFARITKTEHCTSYSFHKQHSTVCVPLSRYCKRVILNIKYNNVPFVKTLGGHRQRVVKEGCRR